MSGERNYLAEAIGGFIDRLKAENASHRKALEFITSKSTCECWDHGVWCGCPAHNSEDQEEWCLTCTAYEALQTTKDAK